MKEFLNLLDSISKDLDIEIKLNPGANTEVLPDKLPATLRDFYQLTNGLELPFVEIYPIAGIAQLCIDVEGWYQFGSDNYGNFCLYSSEGLLDFWNHELDSEPEGVFSSVLELIQWAYERDVLESSEPGQIVIHEIPESSLRAQIVKDIKPIASLGSAEIIRRLANLPFTITCERCEGIQVVRNMQNLGVVCHLDIMTSIDSIERSI